MVRRQTNCNIVLNHDHGHRWSQSRWNQRYATFTISIYLSKRVSVRMGQPNSRSMIATSANPGYMLWKPDSCVRSLRNAWRGRVWITTRTVNGCRTNISRWWKKTEWVGWLYTWNFVFADGTYPSLQRRCKVTSGSSYRGLGSCLQYHRFAEIALNILKACQTLTVSRGCLHIVVFLKEHVPHQWLCSRPPNHHTALGSQEVPKLRDMFTIQLSITPNSPFSSLDGDDGDASTAGWFVGQLIGNGTGRPRLAWSLANHQLVDVYALPCPDAVCLSWWGCQTLTQSTGANNVTFFWLKIMLSSLWRSRHQSAMRSVSLQTFRPL